MFFITQFVLSDIREILGSSRNLMRWLKCDAVIFLYEKYESYPTIFHIYLQTDLPVNTKNQTRKDDIFYFIELMLLYQDISIQYRQHNLRMRFMGIWTTSIRNKHYSYLRKNIDSTS